MKIVINECFGGFGIKPEIMKQYNLTEGSEARTNKILIDLIEKEVDCNDPYSQLVVKEIPDNATDYRIIDYDGAEEILYVVDGKIHSIY